MTAEAKPIFQADEAAEGGLLASINRELALLANTAAPSLVRVQAGRHGAGAGVVVHQEGLIITNAHVANSRQLQVVDWQGNLWPATVRAWQASLDLAALTVEAADLKPLPLANSKELQPGHWLMAMGHPFGVSGGATAGVVIGVGRHLPEAPDTGHDWLAMSLHLRPGHSGGPVVDASGQLVGLNARMAGPEVGLAIPSHLLAQFLKDTFSEIQLRTSHPYRRRWARRLI